MHVQWSMRCVKRWDRGLCCIGGDVHCMCALRQKGAFHQAKSPVYIQPRCRSTESNRPYQTSQDQTPRSLHFYQPSKMSTGVARWHQEVKISTGRWSGTARLRRSEVVFCLWEQCIFSVNRSKWLEQALQLDFNLYIKYIFLTVIVKLYLTEYFFLMTG